MPPYRWTPTIRSRRHIRWRRGGARECACHSYDVSCSLRFYGVPWCSGVQHHSRPRIASNVRHYGRRVTTLAGGNIQATRLCSRLALTPVKKTIGNALSHVKEVLIAWVGIVIGITSVSMRVAGILPFATRTGNAAARTNRSRRLHRWIISCDWLHRPAGRTIV